MPVALTRRAKLLMPVCLLMLVGLSFWRLRPHGDGSPREVQLSGKSMGTSYSVVVVGAVADSSTLGEVIQASLDRIERQMSTYDGESEVMRFNSSAATAPMSVSPEFAEVVKISLALNELSQGALDVTVRPLVALWGFGAGAKAAVPTEAALAAARGYVGSQYLKLEPSPVGRATLSKTRAALEIDLSAVAKGFAVDQVAAALKERGLTDYMIEVGGEVRVSGAKSDGRLWRIGIEKPDAEGRGLQQAVSLRDTSLATSGDYRNFYERDGRRISHTIDARTGRPVSHGLASVSVLHKSAAWADGWATALNVLGPVEGRELAEELGLAALFIVRVEEERFETFSTKAFSRLTADAQLVTP